MYPKRQHNCVWEWGSRDQEHRKKIFLKIDMEIRGNLQQENRKINVKEICELIGKQLLSIIEGI